MKNSIYNKLVAGFGLCLLLIVAVGWSNFFALQKLEKLYQETLRRSVDLQIATDAEHIGEDLYLIIANTVINRDMVELQRKWATAKTEKKALIQKVAAAADTPEEKSKVKEAEESFNDIIRIFEQEMLPLIAKGAAVPGPIVNIDARIDREIDDINQALQWVAISLSNENQQASNKYHAVLSNTIASGLFLSLMGAAVVFIISTLTARRIIRPLAEITRAAQEIEKGNYLVDLNHKSDDETGVLANAFRSMSGQVEKRTVELQTSNEHLQREISDRKLAQEEIKSAYDVMEQRVEDRTAELREKDHVLMVQSRQAALGEMIGNIAHQWRQPLNTLGLTVQQLLLFYEQGTFTREFLSSNVSTSMKLIQQMSKTINDFMNFFKPDKEKADFKVHETIVNTMSLLKGCLQNPLIAIEIVAKDDSIIYGYRNEFAQVLVNILVNARDAIMERKIVDPKVTVTIGSEDRLTVVTIADNAGGIPEEIIDRIFDPYFTTKGPQLGTGIGLYMSKAIIEKNMGGLIGVRNIDNGAEFRIELCKGITSNPGP